MATFNNKQWADPNLDPDMFAPTGLDMDQWLDAVVASGAAGAALTVKHVDGFALWPTTFCVDNYDPYSIAVTTWYANNGNPDITGLFVAKCKARNLKPILYFSIWDTTWEARTGTTAATNPSGYLAMVEAQVTELLTNYTGIQAMWFDAWGATATFPGYTAIPFATIYNLVKSLQPDCLVLDNAYSWNAGYHSEVRVIEQNKVMIEAGNEVNSEEIYISRTDDDWFFIPAHGQTAANLKTAETVLARMAFINANHGRYTLSFGPNRDGHLNDAEVDLLEAIGA